MGDRLLEIGLALVGVIMLVWFVAGVGFELGRHQATEDAAQARDEVCADMCPGGGHHDGAACRCYER